MNILFWNTQKPWQQQARERRQMNDRTDIPYAGFLFKGQSIQTMSFSSFGLFSVQVFYLLFPPTLLLMSFL